MTVSRRYFLKSGAVALAGVGSVAGGLPSFLIRAAASSGSRGKTLVVLFQRGAADGLNIVVPHGESRYYELRPSIAVPRPAMGVSGTTIDLDGFFGLHPALGPFKRLFDEEMLAIVHAAGSPDATRSHFDAQDFMETGTPGVKNTRDGWLNRYLQEHAPRRETSFRAVSSTAQMPRILGGPAPALAIADLSKFGIPGRHAAVVEKGLQRLYAGAGDDLLTPTASETFEAVDALARLDSEAYRPANGASYSGRGLGKSLRQIARLIKADVGLEIAFAEIGGWDHHVNEGGAEGRLSDLLRRFADDVAAFVTDLGRRMDDIVLVTISEFGRTVGENGSRGTDHGHANALFVIGGQVKGGRVVGDWPGLADDRLHEGRDLALTTDFRDVISEILHGHLGASKLEDVFPGYPIDARRYRGLLEG
jgi:uncharacterized protein (DUF1501 family)